MRTLSPFGRFIEIGKKDLVENSRFDMKPLENNITFATVDLIELARHKPHILRPAVQKSLDLVHSRAVALLEPISSYPLSDLEQTIRLMQAGKHMGKLVMRLDSSMDLKIQPSPPKLAQLCPDSCYLIVGGTGGIGRVLLRYLAKLGAKHIATLSRSGGDGKLIGDLVKDMEAMGVEISMLKGDVADSEDVRRIQDIVTRPIRGIINMPMSLEDVTLNKMSYAQWLEGTRPKVAGSMNLHTTFGSTVDFFILIASQGGVGGSYGQSNYNAGNTVSDALARYRTYAGLPARCIDPAVIIGEGFISEDERISSFIQRQGTSFQPLEEFLAIVNHAIQNPIMGHFKDSQVICGLGRHAPSSYSGAKDVNDFEGLHHPEDARYSHIYIQPEIVAIPGASADNFDAQSALQTAKTLETASQTICTALAQKVAVLLNITQDDISNYRSLASYGVDSFISVELRDWIAVSLGGYVQTFELISATPLLQLARMVAKRSRFVPAGIFNDETNKPIAA